jgi:hypothetical protein
VPLLGSTRSANFNGRVLLSTEPIMNAGRAGFLIQPHTQRILAHTADLNGSLTRKPRTVRNNPLWPIRNDRDGCLWPNSWAVTELGSSRR